ncbi:hypothetical protein [uncultured Bradyrhizobium sp.]|uniref:hypothetical protein n=1 Tax=uncultured Bradyrhizobium sp. TaxID=199684 RepID=UPI0035CBED8C
MRHLGGSASRKPFADASIEENWNRTIRALGVSPIFPPEEDLVVGDVLAVVVRDVDIDSHVQTDAVAKKPFVNRSVKLAHVDVSQALDTAYQNLPVFPATVGTVLPLRSGVARAFSDAVLLNNLPRAAFPRLKIQGVSSAASGIMAAASGSANYGADSQQVEEFELSDVRAYGLPSVAALQLFDAFCAKPETAEVCQEATARKHLQRVVGDHINQRFVDDRSGDYRYALEVEIVMVYRVYLTSSIVDLRRTADNQKGGLLALWPFGSGQNTAPTVPAAAPYSPAAVAPYGGSSAEPSTGGNSDQIQALASRLAEVEQKLANVKTGGAISYQSFFGNESSLEGKFERPVAIGYRGVNHDFPSDHPASK